tara:strand:+ start:509 stop:3028 length:2520 start_codon:yes stop_codon:yes gene_type:complete
MPNLIIMHDQTGATGKDIIALPDGITATEALMLHFPQGINPEAVQVFVGITPMLLPNETDTPSPELLQPMKENMIVLMEAKGLDPITIGLFVASVFLSVALAPKIPGDVGQQKQSPNNDLQAQTNIARPYQAYPLVFGSPVSYPDLTGEPIVEYITNQKIVRQLMNVGIGTFDIAETRAGATPITNFTGASATYYEPVAKVVTVPEVINVFSTNEIDGQELLGADNDIVVSTYNLTENGSNLTTYLGTTFVLQVVKDAQSDALSSDFIAAIGEFKLKVNYKGDFFGEGTIDNVSGVGFIDSMVDNTTFYTITLTSFNGSKTVDNSNYDYDTPFVADQSANSIVGPIKIAVETDEVWVNLNFLRGLKSTVELNILFEKLDGPNGNPIVGPSPDSYTVTYTEDTLDQQFRTYKQQLIQSKGYFQVTFERLDNGTSNTNRPDQTTIETVYAVERELNVKYGDLTLLDVVMPATIRATSLRENKVNIELTSKLITYENGSINYTPKASRKMADAILHLTVDFFGLDQNTLALDELYEIQNRLDAIDPRLATFDFTFDDIDVSYDERMDTILQVARCYKWLDGDVYRFGRNEKRDFESTAITRRDIAGDDNREYSLSYNPQLLENFDSVKVEYVDSATNKKAYIFRTINDLGVIIDGTGVNPKSLELAGCSEEFNAINRAELEIRTLLYQRFSLTDTMLPSAMFLDKGAMVLYAEQYNIDGDTFDGEILARSGNVATTSESLGFIDGNQYVINYTTVDGSSVGSFPITPIIGEEFKFQCDDLSEVFLRDSKLGFSVQTGSRYIISTVEELESSRWSVIEKEARGRNVQLTMVNYDERIYDFDGV